MNQTERVATLQSILAPEHQASVICAMWTEKKNNIQAKLDETKELRDYIFATDTSTTSVAEGKGVFAWKNNVHLPKLCEIRDNLASIYKSTWFPNDFWMKWEAHTLDQNTKKKRDAIEAYMRNKVRASNVEDTLGGRLALDYIDYGNVFPEVVWRDDRVFDAKGVLQKNGYVGPDISRISPEDIVFDLTAKSFKSSPKIIRRLFTVGDIVLWAEKAKTYDPELAAELLKATDVRREAQQYSSDDFNKIESFNVDGFGQYKSYLDSGYVEILEFRGTLYDTESETLKQDHSIMVMDRRTVVQSKPWDSWLRDGGVYHTSWRERPDNLWGMGPLDNLVGLQYRIDHLQGAKDDNVDLHIHPVKIITGDPDEVNWGPDAEIRLGEGDSIDFKSPDLSHLQLDQEIQYLLELMEEFAGSPKQSRGFRTPGEKTLGEVSQLESNANRLFLDKAVKYEKEIIEPCLNGMLESGRRNFQGSEAVQVFDSTQGAFLMLTITDKDLEADGIIKPIGARHFGQRNQQLTNLMQLSQTNLWTVISPHIAGLEAASFVNDLLQLNRYGLISQDAQIYEAAESERTRMQVEKELAVESGVDTEEPIEQAAQI